MRNITEHNITEAVIGRFENCPDPRLKEVLTSLVRHLHAFVKESRLTEAEWLEGIQFLTATGHITDDKRQEFILLSDTLGVSMLTVAQNHAQPPGTTEATVFGPFHVEEAPRYAQGADIANGAPGEPLFIDATVRGPDGEPVPNAVVDVWQADEDGFYDVQYRSCPSTAARRAAHRCRGAATLPHGAARRLPGAHRRPGWPHARRERPPSMAAGARALPHPGTRLPHAHHPCVPRR